MTMDLHMATAAAAAMEALSTAQTPAVQTSNTAKRWPVVGEDREVEARVQTAAGGSRSDETNEAREAEAARGAEAERRIKRHKAGPGTDLPRVSQSFGTGRTKVGSLKTNAPFSFLKPCFRPKRRKSR